MFDDWVEVSREQLALGEVEKKWNFHVVQLVPLLIMRLFSAEENVGNRCGLFGLVIYTDIFVGFLHPKW